MEKKQEIAASVAAMFGEATNPDPTSLPEQPTGRTLHFEKVHRAEPAEPLPEPQEQPAPAEAQPEPQPSAEPLISMRGIRKSFYMRTAGSCGNYKIIRKYGNIFYSYYFYFRRLFAV